MGKGAQGRPNRKVLSNATTSPPRRVRRSPQQSRDCHDGRTSKLLRAYKEVFGRDASSVGEDARSRLLEDLKTIVGADTDEDATMGMELRYGWDVGWTWEK